MQVSTKFARLSASYQCNTIRIKTLVIRKLIKNSWRSTRQTRYSQTQKKSRFMICITIISLFSRYGEEGLTDQYAIWRNK
jgi:hypothetical protein